MTSTDFRKIFRDQLKTRNTAQRRAIEMIEGPVMVIAGPGTGKTDVLGLRIGNILEKTDTAIHSILCLTFTESGAVEMRRRLGEYIGPEAYNAQVFTFHGFCNMVIQENLQLFRMFRESQPASDLEQFQVLTEIIDNLPFDSPLKRFTGQIYYETRRLRGLYRIMKQEEWTPEFMHQRIDGWIEEQKQSEEYRYKRRTSKGDGAYYEVGDLKEKLFQRKVVRNMETLRAAVDCFEEYNRMLRDRGRYDYQDMLLWVRDRFEDKSDLLAEYQERYQYFLVDEFQDTNSIQFTLLNLLARGWHDRPDVFIVGDDDQAIYRFQGATMQNITEFNDLYHPAIVVLTENYRSTQSILDASSNLIANNSDRLVNRYPQYTKELTACALHAQTGQVPVVKEYPNWTQEQASVLTELQELHDTGVLKEESVAVIYRQHNQVDSIVHALETREVPINVKKPVNILEHPIIRNVLSILKYLVHEMQVFGEGEHLLFEILHFRFFGISPRDAGALARFCYEQRNSDNLSWREIMEDDDLLTAAGVKDKDAIIALHGKLETWLRNVPHWTLQELLEHVLNESGLLHDVFKGSNMTWNLQVIKTFFDHAREEAMRNPDLGLEAFLDSLKLMQSHDIELPVQKVMTAADGIHFVTAHSAKGMQFDRVYIIGCTKNVWGNTSSNRYIYALPDLSPSSGETDEQDERRLFYVAMTRARKHLTISYSLLKDDGKALEASRFVGELRAAQVVETKEAEATPDLFESFALDLFVPVERKTPLIDHKLLERALEDFEMSLTALNAYLECPRKFYFESILRVPRAPVSYFGFGRAIHDALHQLFEEHVKPGELPANSQVLVDLFEKHLPRYRSFFTGNEFSLQLHHGGDVLTSFYKARKNEWTKPSAIYTEHEVKNVHHRGVPIKGYIDRLDVYKDHVVVTDYKTGKYVSKKARKPQDDSIGGNYWRQIVFYKLLLDADPRINLPMTHGILDFVEPDKDTGKHKTFKITVSPEDEAYVSQQLQETYQKIMEHEFERGCEEDDCYWCSLVNNDMHIESDVRRPPVEEDNFIDVSN